MPELIGLPGTNGKPIKCDMVRSITAALKSLRTGRPITAAGDNGAITVWRDDAKQYRCAYQRYCVTINSGEFKSLTGVRGWLKRCLPRIQ